MKIISTCEVSYPCGLELNITREVNVNSFIHCLFNHNIRQTVDVEECPSHGAKCGKARRT